MSATAYEHDEEVSVELVDNSTALEALNRSEIDMQITTAKRYPRSIAVFKKQAMELATLDEETAGSMFYVLPRGGKKIEGPSVRLAEVVGSSWGNLRYGARVVATDDKFVTAQGACHDLEKNIAINYEVKRRITDKHGRRYNDDMIQVTGNAACAIALREAIFKVVPRSVFKAIYEEAKLTSIGKATSMAEKRSKAVDWFKKAGATEQQVLDFLCCAGVEEISIDDLITLRGLVTAIKDGDTTIEEALAVRGEESAQPKRARKGSIDEPKQPEPPPADERTALSQLREQLATARAAKDLATINKLYDAVCGPEGGYPEDEATAFGKECTTALEACARGQASNGGKKQQEMT